MDISNNAPMQSGNVKTLWVWYTGTDAIREGEAVCHDIGTGTATSFDGKRHNRVARPSTVNNRAFAGVSARDYPASSTGQFIEVYGPGSKGVNIALGADVTLNTGFLTFTVGGGSAAGRFVKAGFPGRGSAAIRQTVTALLESDMAGAWSLATDGKTLTVTATDGISAGDTVVLLGGADAGSNKKIVPGKYTVASITSGTVLVLTASAVGATPSGALTCTGYAYTGNPRCQADLLDGEESGGVEFVSPPNTGAADALTFMTGGVTFICGGVTIASADANGALASGTEYGMRKGFLCLGTLTTKDVTVTPAAAGKQLTVTDAIDTAGNGAPLALASAAFDAANESLFLVWYGVWQELCHSGCVLSAS